MQTEDDTSFIAEQRNPVVISIKGEKRKSTEWNRTAFKRQFLAASAAIVGSISFGMTTGFSATLLPDLAKMDTFVIDESSESWIASSVVLSMLLGVLAISWSMRNFGRKYAQLYLYVPWTIGWLWLSYATNVENLLLGCVLIGLGAGGHCAVSSIYVGETSEAHFRGFISVQISVGVTLGILLSHLQGIFLTWRIALRLNSAFPAIAFLLVLKFAIESPIWLVSRERAEKAKTTFLWLRNDAVNSEYELNILSKQNATARRRTDDRMIEQILSKRFLKPSVVVNGLFVIQQGSGLNVIVFYATKLFNNMCEDIDVASSMIIVDTVRLFASLVACGLIKTLGRRRLYFSSVIGSLISLVCIVGCIIRPFSDTALIIFTCAYIWFLYIGVSPIPWVMVGELYPTNLKEIGSCISNFVVFCVMFVIVKTAPSIMTYFGTEFMFLIYGAVIVIGATFMYFFMPETNNISLQEAEEQMNK